MMTERKIQNYLIGRKREIEVLTDYFYEAYFSGLFSYFSKFTINRWVIRKYRLYFQKYK